MPHVLIVNPSERKGKTKMAKRTAAQQRATRKMIAANRARARARRAPSVSRAKPRRKARVSNPAPARRSKPRRPQITAARASRAGRTLRYRRKNPVGGIGSFVTETLVPSAIGGAGALALDVLLGVLPLPAAMKAGPMSPIIKVAGAVGLGMVAGMVAPRKVAGQIAAGALTVTMYNLAKNMLNRVSGGKIPGLAEYVGDYDENGSYVGEYVNEYVDAGDGMPQIGYDSPGMQVGDGFIPDSGVVEGYETGVYR